MASVLRDDQINDNISQAARDAMWQLMFAWAQFDTMTTQLAIEVLQSPFETGSIFIGTMDTRHKLDRLKLVYQHYGMNDAADRMATVLADHRAYVVARNAVAHSICMGHLVDYPGVLAFSSGGYAKGDHEMIAVKSIPIVFILKAARFAATNADLIARLLEKLPKRRKRLPLEPPEFRSLQDPNPES